MPGGAAASAAGAKSEGIFDKLVRTGKFPYEELFVQDLVSAAPSLRPCAPTALGVCWSPGAARSRNVAPLAAMPPGLMVRNTGRRLGYLASGVDEELCDGAERAIL